MYLAIVMKETSLKLYINTIVRPKKYYNISSDMLYVTQIKIHFLRVQLHYFETNSLSIYIFFNWQVTYAFSKLKHLLLLNFTATPIKILI